MQTLLIAVDGSPFSERALDYALGRVAASREPLQLRLLNVQLPLAGVNVKIFISAESQQEYHREEGMAVLARPRERVTQAGVPCQHHIGVGDPGQVIADYARTTNCTEVIMGTQGRGAIAGAVMGSVAHKVVRLSPVPVVLVK